MVHISFGPSAVVFASVALFTDQNAVNYGRATVKAQKSDRLGIPFMEGTWYPSM